MTLTTAQLALLDEDFLRTVETADDAKLLNMLIRIAGAAYYQEVIQFRGQDRTKAQALYIGGEVWERMNRGKPRKATKQKSR